MHECELCGEDCDCDGEDLQQPAPDDCDHECDDDIIIDDTDDED